MLHYSTHKVTVALFPAFVFEKTWSLASLTDTFQRAQLAVH